MNSRRDFRTGMRELSCTRLPAFILVKKCMPKAGFRIQMLRRSYQLSLSQAIEADFHRRPVRARLRTVVEGVPSSPSISICSALNALTVASSICSSRSRISAPASLRPVAR